MELSRVFSALGFIGVILGISGWLIHLILPNYGWLVSVLEGLALFCFLTFFVRHYQSLRTFSAKRSTRLGLNSMLSLVLAGAILGIVNFLTARHAASWDFSETQHFTLSRQTYQILRSLSREVSITVFTHDRSPGFQAYQDLLKTYSQENPEMKVNFVDPEREPKLAREYQITQLDTAVFESGAQKLYVTKPTEGEITNALLRVTQDVKKQIRFLTGHGEPSFVNQDSSGLSRARDALIKQGYQVDRLFLTEHQTIPDDTSVLVVTSPKESIPDDEQALIQDYLKRGGRLLLLADPHTGTMLNGLTNSWGIRLGEGILVDERDRLGRGSPTALLIRSFTTHDITEDFTIPILLPVSRYLEFDAVRGKGWQFVSLAQTSPESWAETNMESKTPTMDSDQDRNGPFTVAAALSPTRPSDTPEQDPAIVIIGNSAFASNGYLNYPGNIDFFLHVIAWLANENRLISIIPKDAGFRPFVPNPSQEQVLLFFQVLFLPSLMLFTGFSIWRKRQRL